MGDERDDDTEPDESEEVEGCYEIDAERQRTNRIHDLADDEKPREKLLAHGAGILSNPELLGLLMRTGLPGRNVVDMARDLLDEHGSLNSLARASVTDYQNTPGIGPAKAVELAAAFELAARISRERIHRAVLDCPEAVYDLVGPSMATMDREVVKALLVNTRHRHIRTEEISVGSINECMAHPALILKPAIAHSAYGFFLVHNHPSGDPSPSTADRKLTQQLAEASKLVQIQFIDHVIIGSTAEADVIDPYFSFKEMGML